MAAFSLLFCVPKPSRKSRLCSHSDHPGSVEALGRQTHSLGSSRSKKVERSRRTIPEWTQALGPFHPLFSLYIRRIRLI